MYLFIYVAIFTQISSNNLFEFELRRNNISQQIFQIQPTIMGKITAQARQERPKNPGGIYLWFKAKRVAEIRAKDSELEFKDAGSLATKEYNEMSEKEKQKLKETHTELIEEYNKAMEKWMDKYNLTQADVDEDKKSKKGKDVLKGARRKVDKEETSAEQQKKDKKGKSKSRPKKESAEKKSPEKRSSEKKSADKKKGKSKEPKEAEKKGKKK